MPNAVHAHGLQGWSPSESVATRAIYLGFCFSVNHRPSEGCSSWIYPEPSARICQKKKALRYYISNTQTFANQMSVN